MTKAERRTVIAQFNAAHEMAFPPPPWVWALAQREVEQIAEAFDVAPVEMLERYQHREAKYLLARRLNRAYPHPSVVSQALRVSVNTYLNWVASGVRFAAKRRLNARVSASEVKAQQRQAVAA